MENRLKGLRVYLAGAIDRCPDNGIQWRENITPRLQELGCIVFNPLKSPIKEHKENSLDDISYRKVLAEQERYDEITTIVKKIRHNDLRLTDVSDFCICYIDLDIFLCGTFEEISWLNRSKKPVLIVTKQGKKKTPLWLFGCFPHEHIFSTFDELFMYLTEVSRGSITDERWVFYELDEN